MLTSCSPSTPPTSSASPTPPSRPPSTRGWWRTSGWRHPAWRGGRRRWLDSRTLTSDAPGVTGDEFIRRVRRLGRQRGVPVALDSARGKGDHRRLGYGGPHTFVGARGGLKKETPPKMLRHLGPTPGG